jgi:DNA helicase-2/ATP-dependent DNA helicase PcrA
MPTNSNILMVFGPPGAGKTTHLAERIAKAAKRFGNNEIIVSSHTRAAARELVGRKLPIPKRSVGTLHSICWRALGRPEIAELKVDEFNAAFPHHRLSNGGIDIHDPVADAGGKAPGDPLIAEAQRLRARMIDRDLWPAKIAAWQDDWEQWKADAEVVDFTDMIEQALETMPHAPCAPRVGFFDEFQDFTALQVKLVLKWAKAMDYAMFAGDDDQILYSFAGASVDAFLNLDVPEKYLTILDESHRLPRRIKELADAWIVKVSRRQPKEYSSTGIEGEIIRSPATYLKPAQLLEAIEDSITAERTTMILASCAYHLAPIIKALRDAGIPYHNPYRPSRWSPLGRHGGKTAAARLLAFTRPAREGGLWAGTAEIDLWAAHLKSGSALRRGAKKTLGEIDEEFFLDDEVTEYLDAIFVPEVAERLRAPGLLGPEWLIENVVESQQKAYAYPLRIFEKHGSIALKEKPLVIIGTIHSVKGGEADDVILFPDLSLAAYRGWMRQGEDKDSVIRMFYVGMTRARRSLTICAPGNRYHAKL